MVIDAVTLETVTQILTLTRELALPDPELVQVTVARSRRVGGYHMMNGANPVFICSFGGDTP